MAGSGGDSPPHLASIGEGSGTGVSRGGGTGGIDEAPEELGVSHPLRVVTISLGGDGSGGGLGSGRSGVCTSPEEVGVVEPERGGAVEVVREAHFT